jgi:8-oxo-dGTP diphosphatase
MANPSPFAPFPTVYWEFMECLATFDACEPETPNTSAKYVVVFARRDGGFLLADIDGRGWCTPSGRIEPGESALEAAVRETSEETGAQIINLRLIGTFLFMNYYTRDFSTFPAYLGEVTVLDEIPLGSESRRRMVAQLRDLPAIYFMWDELLERVFEYAEGQALESGSSLG